MNLPTRYEIAYQDETATVNIGFIARHSASGLLAFIQSSNFCQGIVAGLPDDVEVKRSKLAWIITAPKTGATLGTFRFTGRTQREAQGASERTFLGARGVLSA